MKLIDKDKVVAEIEKRYEYWREKEHNSHSIESEARMSECQHLMLLLNTTETKEVNPIWNDARKTIPEDSSNQIICIKEDDLAIATIGKLVRGTKKWAYLNNLLNISIDGDASNNNKENLRLICPNCDSQLDTYKSKNKHSARTHRKDYN